MKRPGRPLAILTTDPPLDWSQELALAVLRQAVDDAQDHPHPVKRRQARAWLESDGPGFRFWCGVSGLNVQLVHERVTRLILPAST